MSSYVTNTPFHGGNTGSIPVGRANKIKDLGEPLQDVRQKYGIDFAARKWERRPPIGTAPLPAAASGRPTPSQQSMPAVETG
jgi:hypothetical protein